MIIAVLSDVHGNLAALEAVLADIEAVLADRSAPAPEKWVHLGDAIGYGPQPDEAVRRLHGLGAVCLRGNHEAALLDPAARQRLNPQLRASFGITEDLLSAEAKRIVAAWPKSVALAGARFVHGCPPDEVETYLFEQSDQALRQAMDRTPEPIAFTGHTHDLELIRISPDRVDRTELAAGTIRLAAGERTIINIGSVGQPRDGDNRAKYAIYDSEAMTVEIRSTAYDVKTTADLIEQRGLPSVYARRLW